MTPLVFVLVIAAGGLGAAARFFLDGLISARTRSVFPYGIYLVNFSGSFLLGLATSLAADEALTVIGGGLLGGYTTFSTTSVDTIRLVENHHYRAAAVNSLGALATCTFAAVFGLLLGTST